MQRTTLSLRGLEIFQLLAKSGSVQKVASDTGLSISTVSHHLKNLEDSLGVGLMDHSRRPMILTPSGSIFLRHIEDGLRMIRRGEIELTSGNLVEARELRFGIVDDFDSEVAPELAEFLARAMPRCTFKHHTRPSHEILGLLLDQKLDVGVATRPTGDAPGLVEYPVLYDPFILSTPIDCEEAPEDLLSGNAKLPLLRYARSQIIGQLIEAQLRRLRVSLPNRFEMESNHSVLGMVAEGGGWAITTPASYARAKRFHGRIALRPFPGRGFARTISLFTTEVYPQPAAEIILETLRRLIARHVVDPITAQHPWLLPGFQLLSEKGI
ncbi:MAG: LysR family transcriptional regulator [Boseongicola sp.]